MKKSSIRNETKFCKTCRLHGSHDTEYCPNANCVKCGKRGHLAVICRVFFCEKCGKTGHTSDRCFSKNSCEKCGRSGHSSNDCYIKYCEHCKKSGHTKDTCFAVNPCEKCGKYGHPAQNCRIFCSACGIYGHIASDHFLTETKNVPKTADIPAEKSDNELSDSMISTDESTDEDIVKEFEFEKSTLSWAERMDEEDSLKTTTTFEVKITSSETKKIPKNSDEIKKNIATLISEETSRKAILSPSEHFNKNVDRIVRDTLRFLAENPEKLLEDRRKMGILLSMAQLMNSY